jgi:tetratricopeptide (TPR) repeat protein
MRSKALAIWLALSLLLSLIASAPSSAAAVGTTINPGSAQAEDPKQLVQDAAKLAKDQEYGAAAEKLMRAVELDPTSADAHRALGKVLVEKNDYEGAAAQFNCVLGFLPEDAETWASLGACYHTLGKLAEGIACFRRALEIDQYISNNKIVRDMLPIMERSAKDTGLGASPCTNSADDFLGDATRFRIARWDSERMPLKICVKDGASVPGYKADHAVYLKQAFSDWADASDGKIKLSYVTDESGSDIVCSWTDDPLHLIPLSEGGQALLIADNQGLNTVELKLATAAKQGASNVPITDSATQRACCHLVGHALGLIGHSGNPEDIMAISDGGSPSQTTLSRRDKTTLARLYALDEAVVAQYPLDPTLPPISGNPPCDSVRCELLKCRAASAISEKRYKDAVQLLDEALSLAPHNLSVANEIVLAYTALAKQAIGAAAPQLADQYFKKAQKCAEPFSTWPSLDDFAHSHLKVSLKDCLQEYLNFLESQNRKNDAHLVLSHIRSLEQ